MRPSPASNKTCIQLDIYYRSCDQSRKILFLTNPADGISRVCSEHSDMTLFLQDCKVDSIKALRLALLPQPNVSVRKISQVIGKLTASIQAVFRAPLSRDENFDSRIPLSIEAMEELRWWLAHLDACTVERSFAHSQI